MQVDLIMFASFPPLLIMFAFLLFKLASYSISLSVLISFLNKDKLQLFLFSNFFHLFTYSVIAFGRIAQLPIVFGFEHVMPFHLNVSLYFISTSTTAYIL